ncbi:MAG: InlB B-repeat-containing protein [Anaerovoracaceae bacterium]
MKLSLAIVMVFSIGAMLPCAASKASAKEAGGTASAAEDRGESASAGKRGSIFDYSGSSRKKAFARGAFRSSFDLRSRGVVTPVKLQSPWGSCWAFGAIAASESSILTDLNKTYSQTGLDLSELQLAWMAGTPSPVNGGYEGRTPVGTGDERIENIMTGGSSYLATSVLASGTGPVSESAVPYRNKTGENNGYNYTKNGDWSVSESWRYKQDYRLKESSILPSAAKNAMQGVNALKSELVAGRGVEISYYSNNSDYFNRTNAAYYCSKAKTTNHAVCIVGWNDSYSSSNFKSGNQPPGSGAWLVKNSWGASTNSFPHKSWYGIKDENGNYTGYFWLSYYDKSLNNGTTFRYDTEESKYSGLSFDIAQNDYLNNLILDADTVEKSKPTTMANVFTAPRKCTIESVSCITLAPQTQVHYEVYRLKNSFENPRDGTKIADFTKTYSYGGYKREKLNSDFLLSKGDKYSVVVTEKTAEGKYTTLVEMGQNKAGKNWFNGFCDRWGKFYSALKNAKVRYYYSGSLDRGESFTCTNGKWQDYVSYVNANVYDQVGSYFAQMASEYSGVSESIIRGLLNSIGQSSLKKYVTVDNYPIRAYTQDAYSIGYVLNGGENDSRNPSSYIPNNVVQNGAVSLYDASMSGRVFSGWYRNSSFSGEKVTEIDRDESGDLTLYAKFEDEEYTVTLDPNGGTGGTGSVDAIYDADMPDVESLPQRVGYRFTGFYDSREGGTQYYDENGCGVRTWDRNSDGELYAHWSPVEYSISYILNGAGSDAGNPDKYTVESETIFLKGPVKTGYEFKGWFLNQDFEGEPVTMIPSGSTGDMTLYAKFTGGKYNVALNPNGGAGGTESVEAIYGSDLPEIGSLPVRNGYRFLGCYDEKTGGTQYYDENGHGVRTWDRNSDGELYAHWSPVEYSISYILNGGSNDPANPAGYTVESEDLELKPAAREGCAFRGWFTSADFAGTPVTAIPHGTTGDRQLYAKFERAKYTVKLDPNGGAGGEESVEAVYGSTLPDLESLPEREGYTFLGCYDEKAGGTRYIDESGRGIRAWNTAAGGTLYAHWSAVNYSIEYVLNGGINDPENPIVYSAASGEIRLRPAVRKGHEFTGWYESADLSGSAVDRIGSGSTGARKFYAGFAPAKYKVTLDANGGTGGAAQVEAVYGTILPNLESIPERKGYKFLGYCSTKDGGTMYYDEGGKAAAKWDRTEGSVLYAIWMKAEEEEPAGFEDTGDNKEPGKSEFGVLRLRYTKVGKRSVALKWNKVRGAEKYIVYANRCGTRYKFKVSKTTAAGSWKAARAAGKRLKEGRYHKFFVTALDKGGNVLAVSKTVHVATRGGKKGNFRYVRVTNVKKGKAVLKAGQTFRLKTKSIRESKKRKVQIHRPTYFESSDPAVATVGLKSGKITARGKGHCYIYVYSQSGKYARVNITVKE